MNLHKYPFYIILFLLISGHFISCKCPDQKCDGLDAKYLPLINFATGDSIKFRNDNGNELNFITQQSVAQNTTVNCTSVNLTCHCQNCPEQLRNLMQRLPTHQENGWIRWEIQKEFLIRCIIGYITSN
jgi:hypothetical protein